MEERREKKGGAKMASAASVVPLPPTFCRLQNSARPRRRHAQPGEGERVQVDGVVGVRGDQTGGRRRRRRR